MKQKQLWLILGVGTLILSVLVFKVDRQKRSLLCLRGRKEVSLVVRNEDKCLLRSPQKESRAKSDGCLWTLFGEPKLQTKCGSAKQLHEGLEHPPRGSISFPEDWLGLEENCRIRKACSSRAVSVCQRSLKIIPWLPGDLEAQPSGGGGA